MTQKQIESLISELDKERKAIKTDSYQMSIGELINLYKEGDLELNPAFQRLFRWEDEQKTQFIESILLGIPIPEIFVAQSKDGKWTIVDGVQRISTILQLVGQLPDKSPLKMKMTKEKYLPSLNDLTWEEMPDDIQRVFKRAKLGFNIILTENSIMAQYELFQRLNTGGLHLEPQEIRNCLIIMLKSEFYEKINDLKSFKPFLDSIAISKRKIQEEYHMELILRHFIACHGKTNFENYSLSKIHLSDFLDKETVQLINDQTFDLNRSISHFKKVFTFINEKVGQNAFKKFDDGKDDFIGSFSNSVFEAVSTGASNQYEKIKDMDSDEFLNLLKDLQKSTDYQRFIQHGARSPNKFKNLVEFSNKYFQECTI